LEGRESVRIAPRATVVELPACAQLSIEAIAEIETISKYLVVMCGGRMDVQHLIPFSMDVGKDD
jgi:hypothetical protein